LMAGGQNGLIGTFEYSTDLFEAATIDRLVGYFQTLLAGVAESPGTALAALPLMGEAEKQTLLVDWNRTASAYPRDASIQELFEAEVDRAPEAIALRFGGEALSYRALDQQANRLAHL